MAINNDDLKAPPGKFVVVLIDQERDAFWPQGTFNFNSSAVRDAETKNRDRTGPLGTYFTVFDDRGVEDPHIDIPDRLRKRV